MPTCEQFALTRLLSCGLDWNAFVTLVIRWDSRRMVYNKELRMARGENFGKIRLIPQV